MLEFDSVMIDKSVFTIKIAAAIHRGRLKTPEPITHEEAEIRAQQVADAPQHSSKPIWDEVHLEWVIPYSCKCCSKCWLIVWPDGRPKIRTSKTGKDSLLCIHGGPYLGYVEVPD